MPMKKGSGNLDFGSEDGTDDAEPEPNQEITTDQEPSSATNPTESDESSPESGSETSPDQFPYFVRRNNVGDERDERLEVHLRKEVSNRESEFREALKQHLGADGEISKTDAREFALIYAFENPADVAELMNEEGYGLTG